MRSRGVSRVLPRASQRVPCRRRRTSRERLFPTYGISRPSAERSMARRPEWRLSAKGMSRVNKLAADALAGDLPLELDTNDSSALSVRPPSRSSVELLRHRHERRALCVEDLDQSRAIGERRGQPVDLVDDDNVSGRPWYRRADLHRRPLEIAAREPAIIITGSGQCLALVELVGGEPQNPQTSPQPAAIPLSEDIPVPHFRRCGRDKLLGARSV
jgi:hypothetical protein